MDYDNDVLPTPTDSTNVAAAPTPDAIPPPQSPEQRRRRRVLWFNASHERDVVPLLGTLASARRRAPCGRRSNSSSTNVNEDREDDAPLFDEAWFMEVDPARPSRFAPPTAQEILTPHVLSPAVAPVVGQEAEGAAAVDDVGSTTSTPVGSKDTARDEGPPDAASVGRREEEKEEASAETGAGAWQRTLQQVTCFT